MIQATADKVTSFGTALKLPFSGGTIVKPLATDLTAGQVLQLGWAYFRANSERALHCRLGGEPGSADGESVIFGSEDNVATIAMFTGRSAPLPPPKGLPYAPGCVDRRAPAVSRGAQSAAAAFLSPEPESFAGSFLSRRVALLAATAAVAVLGRRLPRAAPVVGRVEARALVMDSDGEQHLLDRARAAGLALSAGASLIFWNSSKVCPFGQRYS